MRYVLALIIVAIIAAAGVVLATRDDTENSPQNNNDTQTTAPPPPQNINNTDTDNQQTTTDKVTISNFAFTPANITVKKGATVTWTNNDSVVHTVEFETDDLKDSGNLGNGDTFRVTFDDEGTFNYACGPHPQMQGTVTVTE